MKVKSHTLTQRLALLVWCCCTLFSEQLPVSVSLFCAILLHECGHLLASFCFGVPCAGVVVDGLGLRIFPVRPYSFFEQCVVALAGPFANLLSAFILWRLFGLDTPVFLHLLTAFVNLLPISTLDGGQVLEGVLSMCFSPSATYRLTRLFSILFILLGLSLSLGLLWILGQGSYLFFLFFSLFLTHIFTSPQTEKIPPFSPPTPLL